MKKEGVTTTGIVHATTNIEKLNVVLKFKKTRFKDRGQFSFGPYKVERSYTWRPSMDLTKKDGAIYLTIRSDGNGMVYLEPY